MEAIERFDNYFSQFSQNESNGFLSKFLSLFSLNPKAWYPFFFLLLFLLDKPKEYYLILLICMVMDIVVWFLKKIIKRDRPTAEEGSQISKLFGMTPEGYSFPSAHTFTVFQFIPVTIVLFGGWGLLFIPYSLLVAYSRIMLKHHYASDVLAGAIMGLISGFLIVTLV